MGTINKLIKFASFLFVSLSILMMCSCGVGSQGISVVSNSEIDLPLSDKGLLVAFAHNMYEGRDAMSVEQQIAVLVADSNTEYIVAIDDTMDMEKLSLNYQEQLLQWKADGKLTKYIVDGAAHYFVPIDLATTLFK